MDNTKRDQEIYTKWLSGLDYKDLAPEYGISRDRIKEICVKQVPPKIKQYVWQGLHQYAKFRDWMRKEKGLPDLRRGV